MKVSGVSLSVQRYLWTGLLFGYMSLRPLSLDLGVQNGDKVLHLATYAFLILTAPWDFQGRRLLVLIPALVLFGGLMEIGQGMLTTGRSAEMADALANMAGVCLGVIVRILLWKAWGKKGDGK